MFVIVEFVQDDQKFWENIFWYHVKFLTYDFMWGHFVIIHLFYNSIAFLNNLTWFLRNLCHGSSCLTWLGEQFCNIFLTPVYLEGSYVITLVHLSDVCYSVCVQWAQKVKFWWYKHILCKFYSMILAETFLESYWLDLFYFLKRIQKF